MKLLELFAGTQSVGKVARQLGFEVISLDKDMEADIKSDIMDWDYRQYPNKHFDVIWLSLRLVKLRSYNIAARRLLSNIVFYIAV